MSAQPKNTGKEPSTIRLSITLPADEYCELKRLAERNRVSVAIYEEERLNNLKLMTAKMEPVTQADPERKLRLTKDDLDGFLERIRHRELFGMAPKPQSQSGVNDPVK